MLRVDHVAFARIARSALASFTLLPVLRRTSPIGVVAPGRCIFLRLVMKPLATLLLFALLPGCSAGSHCWTDAETFAHLAGSPPSSVSSCTFLGATNGRAYVRAWSSWPRLFGGGDHIYSVALDELPEDVAARVRAGENPWALRK